MCLRKISVKHIKGVRFVSNLYNRIEGLCTDKRINITTMCKESGASRASLADLKMGRKQSLSADTLSKISVYFGVSVDYLLGNEPKEKTPAEADVTFDDFTYAMYGEAKELTDEDKNMLLEMARMLKKRQQEGK